MHTHAYKSQENKSQTVSAVNSLIKSGGESTFQFVDNRPEAIAYGKIQEMANNSPKASQLKALQDLANNSPQGEKTTQLQSIANYSLYKESKSSFNTNYAPIQRVINYDTPIVGDEENTVDQVEKTSTGKPLVKKVKEHDKTMTVFWAKEGEQRYAEPDNVTDAQNGSGSNVKVNVPKIEDATGKNEKYSKSLIDNLDGENKQSAIVVTLHEMVHGLAAMEGTMESGKDEVVHTVWKKGEDFEPDKIVKKEIIPMEEILTVGIKDTDKYKHEFHNIKGEDISATVLGKNRDINENALRNELNQGVKLAYVAHENTVPPTEHDSLTGLAQETLEPVRLKIDGAIILANHYINNVTANDTKTLKPNWEKRLTTHRREIAKAKTVTNQWNGIIVKLQSLFSEQSHPAWLKSLNNEKRNQDALGDKIESIQKVWENYTGK